MTRGKTVDDGTDLLNKPETQRVRRGCEGVTAQAGSAWQRGPRLWSWQEILVSRSRSGRDTKGIAGRPPRAGRKGIAASLRGPS